MPRKKKSEPVSVKITVTSRGITVDQNPVPVRRGERNVQIDWWIGTEGWKFTSDGIVIHRNYLQFIKPRREKDQWFHWESRNSHQGERTYEYTINLTNGKNRLSLDPGIKNGGR